jgi:hypothetical protein
MRLDDHISAYGNDGWFPIKLATAVVSAIIVGAAVIFT